MEFGAAAAFAGNVAPDYLALKLRWFDRFLRGNANGIELEPAVKNSSWAATGRRDAQGRMDHGGTWRTERTWPIPRARPTHYYLQPNGMLSERAPAKGAAPREYRYVPAAPVPTIGGTITSGQPIMVGAAFDQREGPRFFGCREPYRSLEKRADVLVFATRPWRRMSR